MFPGIPEARVEHVLRALSGSGARLIVVDQGSMEVAHEVLIRTWSTLRKWLDEDRRDDGARVLTLPSRVPRTYGRVGDRGPTLRQWKSVNVQAVEPGNMKSALSMVTK